MVLVSEWALIVLLPWLFVIVAGVGLVYHARNRARAGQKQQPSTISYSRRRSIDAQQKPELEDEGAATGRVSFQEVMHRAATMCLDDESRKSMADLCVRHLTVSEVHEGDSWEEPSHRWSSKDEEEYAERRSRAGFMGRARAISHEVAETIRMAIAPSRSSRRSRRSFVLNSSHWSQRASRSDDGIELPAAAHSLVGAWRFLRDENYEGTRRSTCLESADAPWQPVPSQMPALPRFQ